MSAPSAARSLSSPRRRPTASRISPCRAAASNAGNWRWAGPAMSGRSTFRRRSLIFTITCIGRPELFQHFLRVNAPEVFLFHPALAAGDLDAAPVGLALDQLADHHRLG